MKDTVIEFTKEARKAIIAMPKQWQAVNADTAKYEIADRIHKSAPAYAMHSR